MPHKLIIQSLRIPIMLISAWKSLHFNFKQKLYFTITLKCWNFISNQFYSFPLWKVDYTKLIYYEDVGHLWKRLSIANLYVKYPKVHNTPSCLIQWAPMGEKPNHLPLKIRVGPARRLSGWKCLPCISDDVSLILRTCNKLGGFQL